MKKDALEFWERALKTIKSAEILVSTDPDSSVSRSYYAAFYAVSALFALQGKTFKKHSAMEAAVHRHMVRNGKWSKELGFDYSSLMELRATGDYGGGKHVSESDAEKAILAAKRIIKAVHQAQSEIFQEPKV